jgi:SAM-dependent methyltransferase
METNRKDQEQDFFDREALHEKAFDFRSFVKYEYFTKALSQDMLSEIQRQPCNMMLFYGCGQESGWLRQVKRRNMKVIAFDISFESVRRVQVAIRNRLLKYASAMQMDAENLAFADHSFDIVCGKSILHHLELPSSLREIKRVLKRGGMAIFSEPLGFNPIINWFRKLTPSQRTDFEHPFNEGDLASINAYFENYSIRPYFFTAMVLLPLSVTIPGGLMGPILRSGLALDRLLFRQFPFLWKYAWSCLLILKK